MALLLSGGEAIIPYRQGTQHEALQKSGTFAIPATPGAASDGKGRATAEDRDNTCHVY